MLCNFPVYVGYVSVYTCMYWSACVHARAYLCVCVGGVCLYVYVNMESGGQCQVLFSSSHPPYHVCTHVLVSVCLRACEHGAPRPVLGMLFLVTPHPILGHSL